MPNMTSRRDAIGDRNITIYNISGVYIIGKLINSRYIIHHIDINQFCFVKIMGWKTGARIPEE